MQPAAAQHQINLATCGASCSVTFTIGTYAPVTASLARPKLPGGGNTKEWLGAGSGAILALLVFFGIPARRRSWRNMLSILVVMVAIGTLASCGGGSTNGGGGGGGQSDPGTTAGTYTYTVTRRPARPSLPRSPPPSP
jgi:trimeric autotransporter adhesin